MSSIRFESLFSQQVIKEAYFKKRKPESEEPEKIEHNPIVGDVWVLFEIVLFLFEAAGGALKTRVLRLSDFFMSSAGAQRNGEPAGNQARDGDS